MKKPLNRVAFFGDPAGARTQDPHIKSVMLYLLSYRVDLSSFAGAKVRLFSLPCRFSGKFFHSSNNPLP